MNLQNLDTILEKLAKYRQQQINNLIFKDLISDWQQASVLPLALREELNQTCSLATQAKVFASKNSFTSKALITLADASQIETVLLKHSDGRRTVCVSCQVGCPMGCRFCATGKLGLKRNLDPWEIVEQVLFWARLIRPKGEKITNIVYMGMGEPLLNYETTIKSAEIFTHELTKGLSRTRITISTAGIPHKIVELADTGFRVKLALSLHSPFEEIRTKIMPINKKYSLKENIEALKYYAKVTKTRITFEYTMLKNINDRNEDVKALAKLCAQLPSKINIIPFNSIKHMSPGGISSELEPTPHDEILAFADKLRNNNLTVMIRDTQGDDIAAACGQLAVKMN